MVYANTDRAAVTTMERCRTGDYGNDIDEDEVIDECENCGNDLYRSDRRFKINGFTYCRECFKEVLFDEFAWEYEEGIA